MIQPKITGDISPEWTRLMSVAERLQYGEIRLILQRGRPVRIESAIKQIKLDNEEEFNNGISIIPLA